MRKHYFKTSFVPSLFCIITSSASAATISYNLIDQSKTTEIEAGSYTLDGVTMDLASKSGSALNQTKNDFGINYQNSSADVSYLIDNGEAIEQLNLSFSETVVIRSLLFKELGNTEAVQIFISDGEGVARDGTYQFFDGSSQTDEFILNLTLAKGDQLSINVGGYDVQNGLYIAGGGNGGSLVMTSIDTIPIPEPSSIIFVALSTMPLLYWRSRNRVTQ